MKRLKEVLISATVLVAGAACRPQPPQDTPDDGEGIPTDAIGKMDVKCTSKTYTIDSGNGGRCARNQRTGEFICDDKKGNSATMTCAGGCTGAKGKGSCSKKMDDPGEPENPGEGGGSGPVEASIDVECKDGTTFTVGTGTDHGECKRTPENDGVNCKDKKGNSTQMRCATGCLETVGDAVCSVKSTT